MLGRSASDALPFVLCGVVRDRGELRGVEVLDLGPDVLEPRLIEMRRETGVGIEIDVLDQDCPPGRRQGCLWVGRPDVFTGGRYVS